MQLFDVVLLSVVGLIIAVSLMNPGGAVLAAIIGGLILAVRLVAPWVGDYIVSAHSGKKGRLQAQQARQSDDSREGR
ncbi:hypothetical protein [Haloarcula amylovorans]|uniref:hypothetical protein n=1 Tax=Haloarcula amylovorans TaxID=2562280 RepID=UPI001075EB57|nr:hypothetical protein [Halomicroarcula amylolytica]